jgi:hypothetical protein
MPTLTLIRTEEEDLAVLIYKSSKTAQARAAAADKIKKEETLSASRPSRADDDDLTRLNQPFQSHEGQKCHYGEAYIDTSKRYNTTKLWIYLHWI